MHPLVLSGLLIMILEVPILLRGSEGVTISGLRIEVTTERKCLMQQQGSLSLSLHVNVILIQARLLL